MPDNRAAGGPVRSAAVINAEIRERTAGRTSWSPEDLRALRALQAEWREAVAREAALAA
jgi:hypothetical protein